MQLLALILSTMSIAVAHPTRAPSVREICERRLNINEKFALLMSEKIKMHEDKDLGRRFLKNGYTHLLNQAISPFLIDLYSHIVERGPEGLAIDTKKWVEYSGDYPCALSLRPHHVQRGYDRTFAGMAYWRYTTLAHDPKNLSLGIPFTAFNRSAMIRFARAAAVAQLYSRKYLRRRGVAKQFDQATDVLYRASFSDRNIRRLMELGTESVLQAVSLLSAEPLADLTAEDIVKEVIRPRGSTVSLAEQLALLFPARLFGPFGSSLYVTNSVELKNRQLELTSKLRAMAKANHLAVHEMLTHEHGFGCPVAHKISGHQISGLQSYLDAIWFIYEAQSEL